MFAFDIETIPTPEALAMPYPAETRRPPANYKTDETIAKWREADEVAWRAGRIKECSLNPRLGRVVAIGYANDYGAQAQMGQTLTTAGEADLLREFWRFCDLHRTICSWNGHGFDLPFLVVRSALLGVAPTVDVPRYLRRYSYTPHFDAKCAALQWDVRRAGEGLNEWAAAFGLSVKASHGSQVYAMVTEGRWDELEHYAALDARLTYDVAHKLAPFFLPPDGGRDE